MTNRQARKVVKPLEIRAGSDTPVVAAAHVAVQITIGLAAHENRGGAGGEGGGKGGKNLRRKRRKRSYEEEQDLHRSSGPEQT